MVINESYQQGYQAGRSAASAVQMDRASARLIVLALVDHDPDVVVELPTPKVNNADYVRGYARGWTRAITNRSKNIIGRVDAD